MVQSAKEKAYTRLDLSFVEPKKSDGIPTIEIPYSVTEAGKARWKHTIVGYVLGFNPSFREMTTFVNTMWSAMGKVKVHYRGNGNFVFEMSSEVGKMEVIEKGPWSFSRRPMILRAWEPGMPMDRARLIPFQFGLNSPTFPLICGHRKG